MKTISNETNFGRFAYTASVEIGNDVNAETEKLVVEGLASVCFRAGGSEAEKALVAGKHMEKDQKRAEVAFSEAAMNVLQSSFDAKLAKLTTEKGYPKISVLFTGEHTFGEGQASSRKMATNLVEQMRAEKDAGLRATRFLMLGAKEEDTDASVIEKAHTFLASLRGGK